MKERIYLIRYLEEDGVRIVFRRDLPVKIGKIPVLSLKWRDEGENFSVLTVDRKDPFGKHFNAIFTGRSIDDVRRRFIHDFMSYVRLTLLVRKEPGIRKLEIEDRNELRDLVQSIEIYRPKDRRGQKTKWWAKRSEESKDR